MNKNIELRDFLKESVMKPTVTVTLNKTQVEEYLKEFGLSVCECGNRQVTRLFALYQSGNNPKTLQAPQTATLTDG